MQTIETVSVQTKFKSLFFIVGRVLTVTVDKSVAGEGREEGSGWERRGKRGGQWLGSSAVN